MTFDHSHRGQHRHFIACRAGRSTDAREGPNFDFAQALYQISIVLGSVSIVASAPRPVARSRRVRDVATMLTAERISLVGRPALRLVGDDGLGERHRAAGVVERRAKGFG